MTFKSKEISLQLYTIIGNICSNWFVIIFICVWFVYIMYD